MLHTRKNAGHKFLFSSLLFASIFFASRAEVRFSNSGEPGLPKEKMTRLRFYVQDFTGGEKRTVWRVAQSNLTNILPSNFGLVAVLDNLVTSGPEMNSREVGRMQGVIGMADMRVKALVMLLNVVFTKGEYKGSTISILGRNPLDDEVREVPVVGGTGAFRMARGYVITNTYSKNDTYGVFEYNVVIWHLDGQVAYE
ncbi:disease resistance-responsive (dirigent-likeprotein) family protein [Striga asiatica]|uniref:Dirigent protein n=1 Tax=Striga asiatica TaxID=4170 RepID=A0A5A7QNU4_STRAF|nr:disease resistance-responsive (dirigent-likeprotein) family protein [Striga asiatica]